MEREGPRSERKERFLDDGEGGGLAMSRESSVNRMARTMTCGNDVPEQKPGNAAGIRLGGFWLLCGEKLLDQRRGRVGVFRLWAVAGTLDRLQAV